MKTITPIIILFIFSLFNSTHLFSKDSKNEVKVEYAVNFKIEKAKNRTKITITNPDFKDQNFIIYLNPVQKNTITVENINYQTNSIISLSSTFIGLLAKLNELKRVKGIDNKKFIYNQFIKQNVVSKAIKELGSSEMISIEKIVDTKANLILYSGFGTAFPNNEKLKKLNILAIPIYDWKETHPLGKAEWIKLFGILTNNENEANLYFNNLKTRYFKIKNKFKNTPISKPMFSGSLIGDFWYAPAGESYLANLFKDARINYVEKKSKGTGSVSKSFEYSLKRYKNATFWINPGSKSKHELLAQNNNYKYFKALKKKTYCYSHNPNLFWEKSAIEPDQLLLDLIQISHPELHLKRNLYFYKKLK
jgi:iron complex transport system substrate-binding protein